MMGRLFGQWKMSVVGVFPCASKHARTYKNFLPEGLSTEPHLCIYLRHEYFLTEIAIKATQKETKDAE